MSDMETRLRINRNAEAIGKICEILDSLNEALDDTVNHVKEQDQSIETLTRRVKALEDWKEKHHL